MKKDCKMTLPTELGTYLVSNYRYQKIDKKENILY